MHDLAVALKNQIWTGFRKTCHPSGQSKMLKVSRLWSLCFSLALSIHPLIVLWLMHCRRPVSEQGLPFSAQHRRLEQIQFEAPLTKIESQHKQRVQTFWNNMVIKWRIRERICKNRLGKHVDQILVERYVEQNYVQQTIQNSAWRKLARSLAQHVQTSWHPNTKISNRTARSKTTWSRIMWSRIGGAGWLQLWTGCGKVRRP